MPFNKKNYPDNWREISDYIRFQRAKSKCEKCGLVHGGLRWNGKRFVKVVLTTAHIGLDKPDGSPGSKYDTMDCRFENLIALCDRCHLAFDADQHFLSRAIRERAALIAAGQQNLFEGNHET